MDNCVKLECIIQELDEQYENMSSFLNAKTGKIVSITDEEFYAAENDKPVNSFPIWQQENIRNAYEILENDYFIPLPTKFDIHEYKIMERFCLSLDNDKLRNIMYKSIKGPGAFRKFGNQIQKYDLEREWNSFRLEALKVIAIEWCEEMGIEFE